MKRSAKIFGMMGVLICISSLTACSKEAINTSDIIPLESQTYETLSESTATKFSYDDLIVNGAKLGMTEQEVIDILGEPVNIYSSIEAKSKENNVTDSSTKADNSKSTSKEEGSTKSTEGTTGGTDLIPEKIYSYNDLTLVFTIVGDTYELSAAASVGDKDVFARGIKIGDSKDKILEMFYRDADCLNNNYMTDDNDTIIGKYLYGDFTLDTLESKNIQDKAEYGLINYNGNFTFEKSNYIMEFTYFEPPYIGQAATLNDDFAQLMFDIDENGLISGIRWYYYPEIK